MPRLELGRFADDVSGVVIAAVVGVLLGVEVVAIWIFAGVR